MINAFNQFVMLQINGEFTVFSLHAIFKFLFGVDKKDYAAEIDKIRKTTYEGFKAGRVTGIEVYFPLATKFFVNHKLVESIDRIRKLVRERIEKSLPELDEAAHNSARHYVSAFLLERRKKKQFDGVEVYSGGYRAIHFIFSLERENYTALFLRRRTIDIVHSGFDTAVERIDRKHRRIFAYACRAQSERSA